MEYTLHLAILATLGVAVAAFMRLSRRVRERALSRGKGLLLYLGVTLSPALLLIAFGLLMVGIEEWSGVLLVPELFARGFLLASALCLIIAVLAFISFAVCMALMKVPAAPSMKEERRK